MLYSKSLVLVAFAYFASTVSGHGLITAVNGANGITGTGFAVDPTTPRDGSSPNPFEQDTSVIRDNAIASGQTGPCGKTKQNPNIDVATETANTLAAGLPTAGADGSVSMTLHQVNQDGAGPYTCEVDPTGTGSSFQAMTVTSNVPGKNVPIIGSLSANKATNFTLVAQMPAGTTCTGAGQGVCLVRCRNAAIAGPFGGCAAVGQANATTAAAQKRNTETTEGLQKLALIAREYLSTEMMKRSRVAKLLQ